MTDGDRKHIRNCPVCGQFKRKITWQDPETKVLHFIRWQCSKVSGDGEGGYDHD